MAQERSANIFLSYSSEDRSTARDLYRLLSDAGIKVWFDEVALVPGTRWDTVLRNAIAKSSMILMLIGARPPGKWQTVEFRSVLDRASFDDELRIVPVLLPGSSVENLPPALRAYQSIDLRDVSDEDSKLKRIAAALTTDPKTGDIADSEEIGDRLREAGDLTGAFSPYQKALLIATARFGKAHPVVARIERKLGGTYLAIGDLEQAERCFVVALEIDKKSYGDNDSRVAVDLSNLATVYEYRGDLARARRLQEEVLTIRRRVLGEEHPDTLTAHGQPGQHALEPGRPGWCAHASGTGAGGPPPGAGRGAPGHAYSMNNLASTLSEPGRSGRRAHASGKGAGGPAAGCWARSTRTRSRA